MNENQRHTTDHDTIGWSLFVDGVPIGHVRRDVEDPFTTNFHALNAHIKT